VLDVLASAHAKEIVHRDLKPDNLFLTASGQVKVLDFGIARVKGDAGRTHATVVGTTMGTPGFMPPEQAEGLADEVGARSDLWAVGATLFALLTGRPPFVGKTANQILLQTISKPPPEIRSLRPDLPSSIAAVVDRALNGLVEARWSDAAAMQAALRDAYAAQTGAAIATLRPMSLPPPEEATKVDNDPTQLFAQRANDLTPPPVASGGGRPRSATGSVSMRMAAIVGVLVAGAVAVVVGLAFSLSQQRSLESTASSPAVSAPFASSVAAASSGAVPSVPPVSDIESLPSLPAADEGSVSPAGRSRPATPTKGHRRIRPPTDPGFD
jgi:serine/threonine-protein kinase